MNQASDTDRAFDPAAGPRPRRLAVLLFVAYASLISLFQGIQNILVPAAVERLAPTAKVSTLATLGTLSAAATVVAMLAGGWISDRTRTRWGRRTPSLLVSALVTCAAIALLGAAGSIPALIVAMPLVWFAANYYQAVLTSLLPDRVHPAHRGFVSAAMALGVPIGIFAGVNVAARVHAVGWAYALLAIPFLLAALALILIEREPSALGEAQRSGASGGASGLLLAFRSRDFSLAFVSRFFLFLAYFTTASYLLYILQDYVGRAHLPGGDATAAVGTVLSLSTLAWLIVTPLTGLVADRIGHTAAIVGVTSILIGAVMLAPAVSNSWHALCLFGIGIGLTFGVYFAIDLKLAAMVLTSPQSAGREMALMGVAGSGPTILAPALAATIIQYAGFPALFLAGAGLAVIGGLFAFPIRARSWSATQV